MTVKVYRNFSQIATLAKAYEKDGRRLNPDDISIIDNGTLVFDENEILWVGKNEELPIEFHEVISIDFTGKCLLPELVDSHTHLVFGGDRADEYTMRLNGADYEAIANSGGGILSTMNGTNELTRDDLLNLAVKRVESIMAYGVGTIEVKSGYGLNYDKEYECSHVINDLKNYFAGKVQIINTFMAAHAVPKGFSSSNQYLTQVCIPLLKQLASEGIIDAVDIFHEQGYFDSTDVQQLFDIARIFNLDVKSHADEFNDNKGAILAVENNALSTDHLLATTSDGIEALAASDTVATLLPGTGFFLGKPQAEARKFLDAGVRVAIASDYNPGSCHCDNVLLIASLAAPHYKLNIAELWSAITLNAAHSLGLRNQGAIVVGLTPRFTIFDSLSISSITYNWGKNLALTY